jgi:hypothetical protein
LGLKRLAKATLSRVAEVYGYQFVPKHILYDWQKQPLGPSYVSASVPKEATEYLHLGNSRLRELQEEYERFDAQVTDPLVWVPEYIKAEDLKFFRGDNPYVYQMRKWGEINYALVSCYLAQEDNLGLLEKLEEDGLFGARTWQIDGKVVSRDLLDSVNEILFIEEHLSITERSSTTVVDIGAGYGRLAHRMLTAFPNISNYYCVDAVAASTFLSEYYLKFRELENRSAAIPLYKVNNADTGNIDLAVNIHSFSECTLSAISWWCEWLKSKNIRHLFVVPNRHSDNGEEILTNVGENFRPILEDCGYRLRVKRPKYKSESVQKFGIAPTYYYLFELSQKR